MASRPLRRAAGRLACVLLTVMAVVLGAAAFPPTRYVVAGGSQFWIDGTSTLGRYTCAAGLVAGHGDVDADVLHAELTVPVGAIDCGQARMTRDLVAALRGDDHPAIEFTVDHAERLGPAGDWQRVRATGRLRLAGAERPLALDAEGRRRADGRLRIRGTHALRMTDFGVDPPRGLGGLVRAHDRVVARFDLVVEAR
jgi:polyisoprenoid-binding protein YceI